MGIQYAILSFFVLALTAPWLHRFLRNASGWALALLPAAITVYLVTFVEPIGAGEQIQLASIEWVPSLEVNLSFYLDGLSLVFALLITGIGALILVYSGGYLAGHLQLGRFYAYLLAFTGSMFGMVLADNLLTLFVFWELTSLTSFLLIGFHHERAEARSAAWQALIVTGGGGLALMAGVLLLGHIGGSFELSQLLMRGEAIREHGLYLPTLGLILVGAFTKSAQFPFHFWLPNAMEAPTPVSAFLHSATMVKAGIYLLARLHPILGGTAEWYWVVTSIGAATMLVGGFLAVTQFDLKRILAYSTISALGTLTLLLGLGNTGGEYGAGGIQAAMVFLVAHALYKGALFMVAGAVDHETGSRDVRELSGLRHAMPITAAAATLAALSLAGLGPFLSFIGKEQVFQAVWDAPDVWFVLVPAAVFASALFVMVAALMVLKPFFGPIAPTPKLPHEAPLSHWLGPLLLAVIGLIAGLWPGPVARLFIAPSVTAIVGERQQVYLSLWHGVNPALMLSMASLALGTVAYLLRERIGRAIRRGAPVLLWGPETWYRLMLRTLNAVAAATVHLLQSGYLRYYILSILVAATALVGYTLLSRGGPVSFGNWRDVAFYEGGLAVLIILAALMTVLVQSRLTAIAALGVVGYSIALQFVLFGAPDVAMTQFLIETLMLILFLLVFYHLPDARDVSRHRTRARDVVIAGAAGMVMGTLVLFAADVQLEPSIARFYSEQSVPEGHGRNVVNVILVDFRALDTLGEITVLAAAGIGVYALLKLKLGSDRMRQCEQPPPNDAKPPAESAIVEGQP